MRKTTMKTTTKNHDADVIADAQAHAEAIARDEAAVKAEYAAFNARGEAKDAREKVNKNKSLAQFEAMCRAIQVRNKIIEDVINLIGNNRTVEVDYVIRVMVHLGHDLDLVKIAVETANELEIMDNFVTIRRTK